MSQLFTSGGQNIGVSASISVLPNEHSGLISFRMDWLDLLGVQGTLECLQHHGSKASKASSPTEWERGTGLVFRDSGCHPAPGAGALRPRSGTTWEFK